MSQMQIAMVQSESSKAPTTGQALYIVVEQSKHRVVLLHPTSLTRLEIPALDFTSGFKGELWPNPTVNVPQGKRPINEGVAAILQVKARELAKRGSQFPVGLVRTCIAHLLHIGLSDVPEIQVSETTASGQPRVSTKSAAKPGVVQKIEELLKEKNGVTLEEAVKALKAEFPDRNADGMRTTVRCQLLRIPKKTNTKLITTEVPKRGKVFRLEK